MLEKEYEGSVCEIRTLKNVLVATGRIDRIEDAVMEVSDPSGPIAILPYKTPVKIAVFNNNLGFRMMAGQVYMANGEYIRVMNSLDFLEYERRRFFRLDIDAAATLVLEEKQPDGSKEILERPVRIKNLSLCGVMFESAHHYPPDQEMILQVKLYKGKLEPLRITIHRGREWEKTYIYGAEIMEMSRQTEQSLCAFLFEQQRLQIQRSKTKIEF